MEDFTEQEVTKAFQGECQSQGEFSSASIYIIEVSIHPSDSLVLFLALRGETGKMRETHEAYQVTLLDFHLNFHFS